MKILNCILLVGSLILSVNCTPSQQSETEFYLLVGTYTSGASDGIYIYKFNSGDGSLSYVSEVTGVDDPSYLAVSPDNRFVYAVNALSGESEATVSSFSFDKTDGTLSFLNKQSSGGGGPCYVSVDETGKMIFAGNYQGGSLSMLPVEEDGSLGEAETTILHEGSSINKNRQARPHVHCTFVSPDNNYLMVADLGTDRVTAYPVDSEQRILKPDPVSIYETEPGAGPRHITFHPNGQFAYLINELNGTVIAFSYDDGVLSLIQTVSSLPADYEGRISGADIHVSPDGNYLYASNREDLNSIVVYSIDKETGSLEYSGEHSSEGIHPRNFMIDPTGNYLLAANRHSNNIVVFQRDAKTGSLTPTGTEVELSQPVCLKMIPVH